MVKPSRDASRSDLTREGSTWKGVLVASDDHAGLRKAIAEVRPEAIWQRCYVHFLRNALDHLTCKGDDDCLRKLRWLYDRRDVHEARKDLAGWLQRWQKKYAKLCAWVEDNTRPSHAFWQPRPVLIQQFGRILQPADLRCRQIFQVTFPSIKGRTLAGPMTQTTVICHRQ